MPWIWEGSGRSSERQGREPPGSPLLHLGAGEDGRLLAPALLQLAAQRGRRGVGEEALLVQQVEQADVFGEIQVQQWLVVGVGNVHRVQAWGEADYSKSS